MKHLILLERFFSKNTKIDNIDYEYQYRNIDEGVYYKRKKGDKLWSFTDKNDFYKHSKFENYSGRYSNSREFIIGNNLQKEFSQLYNINGNIEDAIIAIGDDENVIKQLLPNDYYFYYNPKEDVFVVTKKKNEKKEADIHFSTKFDENKVKEVFDKENVFIEYDIRFTVYYNGNVIGGTTYYIDDDYYYFDIALLKEYQGYGISKQLLEKVINDAKTLDCQYVQAEVINYELELSLRKMGFDIEDLDYKTIATLEL